MASAPRERSTKTTLEATSTQGLEPQSPGSCEEIEYPCSAHILAYRTPIQDSRTRSLVGLTSRPPQGFEAPTLPAARDDPHGALSPETLSPTPERRTSRT